MTTISYPSDPVVNGATEIQATIFNVVPADYIQVEYSAVSRFVADNGPMEFMPTFRNGVAPSEWQFFRRKDLTGSAALNRNLIGVRVVKKSKLVNAFVSALAKVVGFPIGTYRVEAYNWFPSVVTLTSGTAITVWGCTASMLSLAVDPETNALLYGDGAHRATSEADGFLCLKVAANKPLLTPAANAIGGTSPV